MASSQYEEIHKDKIEYRIHERYKNEIRDLESLGFHDLHFTREVTFPLSAVFLFFIYPGLKHDREIFTIEKPLRYVILNPLLLNHEYDTYAHVFTLGVKFLTLFKARGLLVSCNYNLRTYERPKQGNYRYSVKASIADCFEAHQNRIAELEEAGMVTDDELSLPKFELAMAYDDKALLSPF